MKGMTKLQKICWLWWMMMGVARAATIEPPTGLMINLLTKPEISVVTTLTPTFSWVVPLEEEKDRQTAYQLLVASSATALDGGKSDLWDSGKVESGNTLHIAYAGEPLNPHTT